MFGLVSEQEIKVHVYVFDILTGNQSTWHLYMCLVSEVETEVHVNVFGLASEEQTKVHVWKVWRCQRGYQSGKSEKVRQCNGQTMIYKTIHRKLEIEQHYPLKNGG
jgi:hypothetical protein